MHSDWWKFNECMMSGTRSPVRYIRRGEEGVRASDIGPSENQATYAPSLTESDQQNLFVPGFQTSAEQCVTRDISERLSEQPRSQGPLSYSRERTLVEAGHMSPCDK